MSFAMEPVYEVNKHAFAFHVSFCSFLFDLLLASFIKLDQLATPTVFLVLSDKQFFSIYSQLWLSRLRLSRITAYLGEKIWSLFQHRNLKLGYKIL